MIEQKIDALQQYRAGIVGIDHHIETPYGKKKLVYSDWIASGRLYKPIEDRIINDIGPLVANTHSESSTTGRAMTYAYHKAQHIIKRHVNANSDDVIITTGTGMTGALSKLIRILGLKLPEWMQGKISLDQKDKPVIFVTHMEHHSNQISWLETIADVVVIPPAEDLTVSTENLESSLTDYADRTIKIGAFTACSNVTGIKTRYHELAKIMHEHDGICLVDFAASAPYVNIDMHPEDSLCSLDGIFFSPHKFLGGPGASGVLIFNKKLYKNTIPDEPGGGTVTWTNPWGGRRYFDDIEQREDGGTPGFLQAIRSALCIQLKEEMGVERIESVEKHLVTRFIDGLKKIPSIKVLADDQYDRIGAISFYSDEMHFNLMVKLLNDRFGIQVRGGCSCAGTYGHYLLHVDEHYSQTLTKKIDEGDLSQKPGWIRTSIHPTTTINEIDFILDSIEKVTANVQEWRKDYKYDVKSNEFFHHLEPNMEALMDNWF
ncbi:MAG: aminotransferase class V-fold PLP-dependent enzyme [Cyclobacteriaceae bacterium]